MIFLMTIKTKRRILRTVLMLIPLHAGIAAILVWALAPLPHKTAKEKSPQKTTKLKGARFYKPGEALPGNFRQADGQASIVFTGDIMLWDRYEEPIARKGVDYPFEAVASVLRDATLTVGNLECPVTVDAGKKALGRYIYQAPPKTLPALLNAGYDVMDLANNHIRDCRQDGVLETMRRLEESGLKHFGAGENAATSANILYVDAAGLRIAFIGFLSPEIYLHTDKNLSKSRLAIARLGLIRDVAAKEDTPGAWLPRDEKDVAAVVAQARAQADLVCVVGHWGVRYRRFVHEYQEKVAHAAVDAGADIVLGSHAHFWQPAEVYRGKPILYGLGNFAFGSVNRLADEALLVRARIDGKKIVRIELFPVCTNNKINAMQPRFLKGAYAINFLQRLREWSAPRSADIRIDGEKGVLELAI
jgi:poly-gamma-glutamate capsule biosynthesis protein CapA/YwtB (metallophosphatase superfamily)